MAAEAQRQEVHRMLTNRVLAHVIGNGLFGMQPQRAIRRGRGARQAIRVPQRPLNARAFQVHPIVFMPHVRDQIDAMNYDVSELDGKARRLNLGRNCWS